MRSSTKNKHTIPDAQSIIDQLIDEKKASNSKKKSAKRIRIELLEAELSAFKKPIVKALSNKVPARRIHTELKKNGLIQCSLSFFCQRTAIYLSEYQGGLE